MDHQPIYMQAVSKDGEQTVSRSYQYDRQGQLLKAYWDDGFYQYKYNANGYLSEKSWNGKLLYQNTYDANGNIRKREDYSGAEVQYDYDKAGRLSTVKDLADKLYMKYSYDSAGRITAVQTGNDIRTEYQYDGENNLTHLVTKKADGTELQAYTYQYDGNGNRVKKMGTHEAIFRYDSVGRLNYAEYDGRKETYTYDCCGNRLAKRVGESIEQYSYNKKNQLVQRENAAGIYHYLYDMQGNPVTEETPEGIRQYHYNPLNEQTKVILGDKTVWKNQYDAEGLRYAAEENGKPSWFIFDMEQNLMAELTETAQISTRYIWGEDIIAAEYPAGTKEDRYYYTQDEQRSTIFLTDENANIKNSYYYDAFGKILEQEETIPNRIRYTGQQWDSAAEQYYLRARYYNPILGRFMQEDVYWGDGLNLYAYCANNPVMFYDPSGFDSQKLAKAIMEALGISGKATGYQAGHLILDSAKDLPIIKISGIDVDAATNGILVRDFSVTAEVLTEKLQKANVSQDLIKQFITNNTHHGVDGVNSWCHWGMNRFVKNELGELATKYGLPKKAMSGAKLQKLIDELGSAKIGQLKKDIEKLQDNLRKVYQEGVDLYEKNLYNRFEKDYNKLANGNKKQQRQLFDDQEALKKCRSKMRAGK